MWEVGEVDDRSYLVMELVAGETLAGRLERGPMAEGETLALGRSLARTLAAVHARGLLHRDVKPQNIVIEVTGAVRLVDFGLVTPSERSPDAGIAGTRPYLAPEQVWWPHRADARADLYALGSVLFEAISGYWFAERGPASLSSSLASAGVSERANRVLGGLLAADPRARYPTGEALARDLDRLLAGEDPEGPTRGEPGPIQESLVGREDAMAVLRRAWGEAASGRGAMVRVEGDPGSGKTRLLSAFAAEVGALSKVLVVSIRCTDGPARPLSTLSHLLEALGRTLRAQPPARFEELSRVLRTEVSKPLASLLGPIAPSLARIVDAPSIMPRFEDAQDAFVETLADVVCRLIRATGPVLLGIDDMQWMDGVSVEVLARLAHRAADLPLLILGATRSDGLSTASVARLDGVGGQRFSRVRIAPLDIRCLERLVREHLGAQTLPGDLVPWLHALGDGTPLAVLELSTRPSTKGLSGPTGAAWRFDPDAAERMRLPREALALLDRRLDALPPKVRRFLEIGATIGAVFQDDLAAATAAMTREELVDVLGEASSARVVDAHRARLLPVRPQCGLAKPSSPPCRPLRVALCIKRSPKRWTRGLRSPLTLLRLGRSLRPG